MKPRPRLPRPPMNIDHNSPSSSSPSSLASTLEYQRKQAYLEAAVAAQQQQQLQQHFSQQHNKQLKAVQKSIMSHQRNNDRGINNHFINNSTNNTNINNTNNNNNNILTKHHQLQQLLKSNSDNINNSNQNLNSSTRSTPFVLPGKSNWPQGSISASQAPPPSMPTSLLNLAACSSSNQAASSNIGSSSSARSRNLIHSRVNSNSSSTLATGNMPATRSSSLIRSTNNITKGRNQASLLQDEVSRPTKTTNSGNSSVIHHKPSQPKSYQPPPPPHVGPKRLSSKSTVKSDLSQSHNLGSQSVTIELVSSSHNSDVQKQANTKIDYQDKDMDYLSSSKTTADDSVLQPSISLGNKSRKHVNAYATGMLSDSDQLTNEVKSLVLEECNIIYECKACSNLFRSLPNFVKHKRAFCQERSVNSDDGVKGQSMVSLLSSDSPHNAKSDDKTSTVHGNDDQDNRFTLEPNSAIVDLKPTEYENGNIMTHTYNSRGPGKKYNLAHELRMLRLLHNHDRKAQQQKEAARQKELSLIVNETIPAETSLSKLLQSQPKARLPASQDKALIEALTIATATSPVSSNEQQNTNYESTNTKDSARSTPRKAHSILSTKSLLSVEQDTTICKRTNQESDESVPSQSTRQLQSVNKKIAPKRKFLEDCIQKVKRDKKLVDQEDQLVNVQLTSIRSNSNAVLQTTSINSPAGQCDPVKERLDISSNILETSVRTGSRNNSQIDSDSDDMLTIDLGGIDESKKKPQPTKGRRRSTTASNPKVSSSSALLKALTRPVLEQNQTVRNISSTSSPDNLTKQVISNPISGDTSSGIRDSLPIDIKMTCDICNIDFVDSQSLVLHNETEHLIEKLVYPCLFCSMSFTLLENACKHIADIHKKPGTELHRLKDVVKFRSHLTTDFSTCEDYVPSNDPADTPDEFLGGADATVKPDEVIEKTPSNEEKISTVIEETQTKGISETIPDKTGEEKDMIDSKDTATKARNIHNIVKDIVSQVVENHPAIDDRDAATNPTSLDDFEMTPAEDNTVEKSEPDSLLEPRLKERDSEILESKTEPIPQPEPSHENQNYLADDEISNNELELSDLSDDSKHSEDVWMQEPARVEDKTPEPTACHSIVQHDSLTNSDSNNHRDPSSIEDYKDSDDEDTKANYQNSASGDECKRQQQPKIEQEISRMVDKRDSRIAHESSSKKHHSKDDTRHTKSHDKNKSRSRSSSTEHVRSDEKSHHKSSSNHHTSSAKKTKHQSKGEPKTSPVPTAEPIMKLKIQLKTRPDEKCKVYEIV